MQERRSSSQSDVPRRQALTAIAVAAAAVPAAAQQRPPQHKHEGMLEVKPPPVYKPRFFTAEELKTLHVLVDLIIPRTDTPGASDAGVHNLIDASVRPAARRQWREGLEWVDSSAGKGRRFTDLAEADRVKILERAGKEKNTAGSRFFRLLKGAVVDAYYSTKEGLVTELGWNANTYLPEFKGCTHPEHQS